MNEMIYKNEPCFEVLDEGVCKDWHYKIVSYGTHPCAYVEIPKGHDFYDEYYDYIPISCHGGLTFSGFHKTIGDGFYIGWDYAHCEDLYGAPEPGNYGKKWTTEEIFEEVKNVIEQIKGGYKQ